MARNLTKPDYVAVVCGSLAGLPRAFATLDVGNRTNSLPVRQASAAAKQTATDDIATASLPKVDRGLVRTDVMRERVLAEARSRAPRRQARAARSGNRRLTP